MNCNQRFPASTLDEQRAIDRLLAKEISFGKTQCKNCNEYNDNFLTTEDGMCFTCACDAHFEELKTK